MPPETQKKLAACAAQVGKTAEELALTFIEDALRANGVSAKEKSGGTLDEILAPVRQEFEQSGMTDDDLANLSEELREKVWQEKHGRKTP